MDPRLSSRIVVIGALAVIVSALLALYIAAQPAIVIQPAPSVFDGLSRASGGAGRVELPVEQVVAAGSPWLRLVLLPMVLVGVVLVVRPRVAGAVMWSLASLGVGAMLLILRTVAPFGLPRGAGVTDLWPRAALPVALTTIFVAHASLLAALAVSSRGPRRPRTELPRATLRTG